MREPLHSVADAEHGDAEGKHGRVAFGSLGVVDGAGSAGEHDAAWLELADFVERGGARENGGEDLLFADAAGNELRVLAAEIEDDYAAAFGVGAFVMLLHLDSAGHCPPISWIAKAAQGGLRDRCRSKSAPISCSPGTS